MAVGVTISNVIRVPSRLAPLSAATKLTTANCASGSVPASATMAVIRAEGAAVRYLDTGVGPTATIGQPILTSDPPLLYTGTSSALEFIQQAPTATVDVLFYR